MTVPGNGREKFLPDNRRWHDLFEQNTNRLFFLALLITGNADAAESALLMSMDVLEADRTAGGAASVAEIERVVARCSLEAEQHGRDSGTETSSLLPLGLRAVLRLSADLRCCFVLRLLVRYSNQDCARILNREGNDAEMLVRTAVESLSPALSFALEAHTTEAR